MGTWHDPDLGRPIAAPLEQCAKLLDIDLATVRELAANVEPYLRADGTRIWSLMQLERQLGPRRTAGGAAATSTADGFRPMANNPGVGADVIQREVLQLLRPSCHQTSGQSS